MITSGVKHLLLILCCCFLTSVHSQTITTIAGTGIGAFNGDGNLANTTTINGPFGVAVDTSGNVYVADRFNHRIRKVANNGIMTTVAGNGSRGYTGDGFAATNAQLNEPTGVAVDNAGNIYIADRLNNVIRMVKNDTIQTIAGTGIAGYNGDGIATAAQLNLPRGVSVSNNGIVVIADQGNQLVRVSATTGMLTTVAGNSFMGYSGDGGAATQASLNNPASGCIDDSGNLYIADVDNQRIRLVHPNGIISTFAGTGAAGYSGDGGPATNGQLHEPICVAVNKNGELFIADGWNYRIRKVAINGVVTTIAGNGSAGYSGDGGDPLFASLHNPYGVAIGNEGATYIADYTNNRIRKVTIPNAIPALYQSSSGCKVYPNPCNGKLSLSLPENLKGTIEVYIAKTDGSQLSNYKVIAAREIDFDIPVNAGTCLLKVIYQNQVWVQTIIVR